MNPEHISGTTAQSAQPKPQRRRPEDNDKFLAAKAEAVAFALAHIDDPTVSLFGRVKVAGDTADSGPIERAILLKVVDLHGKEWVPIWKGQGPKPDQHKKDTIRNLIRIAIFEELYGRVCPQCHGRRWVDGEVPDRGKFFLIDRWFHFAGKRKTNVECDRCKGRGISKWTDTDRAAMMGMPYKTFVNTWSSRLKKIRGYLGEYEDRIWWIPL